MLLDISLPDRSGIEVLKQIKKEKPELAVLMLSMHREDQYAIRSLKAGAAGYLTKQSAPRELVTAIRQVAAGKSTSAPRWRRNWPARSAKTMKAPPHDTLSDREYQTLTMIASGKTVSADRRGTVAVGQDRQRIPRPPAGQDETQEQCRTDALRDPQPAGRLTPMPPVLPLNSC